MLSRARRPSRSFTKAFVFVYEGLLFFKRTRSFSFSGAVFFQKECVRFSFSIPRAGRKQQKCRPKFDGFPGWEDLKSLE
jgi:hypothetical protein